MSRNRNKQYHDGVGSPYGQHFQDGGRDAVLFVGGSLATIGAASYAGIAGINWWTGMSRIQQLRKMAMGRKVLRNINFGSGAGDLSTQLLTNGGDWSKVNWTSVAGQTFVKGKFAFVTNSALGSFVKLDVVGDEETGEKFRTEFKSKNFTEFGTNLWGNGVSQLGGNLWGTSVAKQVYDGLANMVTGSLSEGAKNSIIYGDVQGYSEKQRER